MASESPQARRRARMPDHHRNPSLIRASVLESALELGFAHNSTVAHWIFNNPLSEDPDEPDSAARPHPVSEDVTASGTASGTTSGSNTTSDDSSSLHSPRNIPRITTLQVHMHKPSVPVPPHVHFGDFSSDQLQLSPFSLSPPEPYHGERARSHDDAIRRNPAHECPSPGPADTGYTSEGQYLSKGSPRKGKDIAKTKIRKGSKPKAFDIDKPGDRDLDYASDGGYLSASSHKSLAKSPGKVRSRAMAFFRRRQKKSARGSDDDDEDDIPPVPAIPSLPIPSSPKPLERRAAPSSPTPSGFTPLTLKLSSPPVSPPRRRVRESQPSAHVTTTPPQGLDRSSALQPPASAQAAPAPPASAATPATFPLPPPVACPHLSASSFPAAPPTSTARPPLKSNIAPSSRQHLGIPPPAPPPTLPLPQPPPPPSTSPDAMLSASPAPPTTPSRRSAPSRPVPVVSTPPGSSGKQSARPLSPHRTASQFRPLLSTRVLPAVSHNPYGEFPNGSEGNQANGKEDTGRQRSVTALSAGLGSTPAFLQRRMQHGPSPSPPHPPPDAPLPPSPSPSPSARSRTQIGSPSKFHEHFPSVSSVPVSHVLSTPTPESTSRSPSTATLSGSSSDPSVRSSHTSSASDRSEVPAMRDALGASDPSLPAMRASTTSEASYGQRAPSVINRPTTDLHSRFSDRSDVSSSMYTPTTHVDSSSATACNDDDGDVNKAGRKSFVDAEDDDASVYPSDDKTAGRRTMYLVEHGELDENGDEIVISGSQYWGGHDVPPPLPPLPPMPSRPGPGYF